VLDALRIRLCGLPRGPDGEEEVDHQTVALTGTLRHSLAGRGEKNAAVRLENGEALAFQASDCLARGGMGDAEVTRDVGRLRTRAGAGEVKSAQPPDLEKIEVFAHEPPAL